MKRRFPIITLIVVGLSVLVRLLPWANFFVYDRNAILAGEWWRAVTGHWVHFSLRHFLYDTIAFGIAGWMIENRNCKNFAWLCVLAVFSISASMLLIEPRLQICGGLSGLATAAGVFLAVNGLAERGAWRWICSTALLLCAVKLSLELKTGKFVFLQAPEFFSPVPCNHIAGALTALAVFIWSAIKRDRQIPQSRELRLHLGAPASRWPVGTDHRSTPNSSGTGILPVRTHGRTPVPLLPFTHSSPDNSKSPAYIGRARRRSGCPCFSGSNSRAIAAPKCIRVPQASSSSRAQ
jgi:rhomboid family GlyGly-CTERM serine protease